MTSARHRFVGHVTAAALAVAGSALIGIGLRPATPPRPEPPAVRANTGWPAGDPGSGFSATPTASSALARSTPVVLDIPAIDVHTGLVELGLNPDGTVALPPLTADAPAGWYRNLASPGEPGTAVILGHVDSAHDGPAVFFRLGALRPGDSVSVTRADGSVATFTVVHVAEYPKNAFPTNAVYGPVSYPALRLITCGGGYDRSRRSYRANIVVYAALTGARSGGQRAPRPVAGVHAEGIVAAIKARHDDSATAQRAEPG